MTEYLVPNENYGYDSNNPLNPCNVGSSCKSCNRNMASNDPATQYQRLKIIQNTVRVKSSLYTMNLGALNVYQKPKSTYGLVDIAGSNYIVSPGVNWNQMSDRREPHVQVVKTASGSTYGASSTRSTITRLRPGALSPGGSGVDIKHNSYDRYLNRLKGKGPVRRGVIPSTFGTPYIPFNRAYPVYGGKTMKTSIVSGCDCPIDEANTTDDTILYQNSNIENSIYNVTYTFTVGDFVWAKKYIYDTKFQKGTIIAITDGLYTVRFEDNTEIVTIKCELLIYYDCNCDNTNNNTNKEINFLTIGSETCSFLTRLSDGSIL
jgi:hypothetical protein